MMDTALQLSQVQEVLDQVQPMIEGHGGRIELVNVEDAIVYVRLHGACISCPSSFFTITFGIEEAVRKRLPHITRVTVVE